MSYVSESKRKATQVLPNELRPERNASKGTLKDTEIQPTVNREYMRNMLFLAWS